MPRILEEVILQRLLKGSKFLFCPFLLQDCLKPGPGEDRARTGRGPGEAGQGPGKDRARTGEWKGVRGGEGRKTLVFGGYESVNWVK